MSRAELTRRLGTSQAYVTMVLRGNVNFTRATLVKLARAVEGEVRLDLCEPAIWPDRRSDRTVKPVRRPAVSRATRIAKARYGGAGGRADPATPTALANFLRELSVFLR